MYHKIKIIIYTEDEFSRSAFAALLNTDIKLKVVAEVGSQDELFRVLKKLETDIVIIEIKSPYVKAIEFLSQIKTRYSHVKIIMHGEIKREDFIKDLFSDKLSSYLLKPYSSAEMLRTIKNVYESDFWLEQSLVRELFYSYNTIHKNPVASFTKREKQIYRLIMEGLKTKEISERLSCSISVVNFHRRNLNLKTNSHSTIQLVWYAQDHTIFCE